MPVSCPLSTRSPARVLEGVANCVAHNASLALNFLELSQAPPALPIMAAIIAALPMHPARSPVSIRGPTMKPAMRGVKTAYKPGAIISFTS